MPPSKEKKVKAAGFMRQIRVPTHPTSPMDAVDENPRYRGISLTLNDNEIKLTYKEHTVYIPLSNVTHYILA